VSLIKTISFKTLGDGRGSLVALEGNKNVPFDIKRAYYIFGTKEGVSRGFHAHRNLKQVAVCVLGSCRFVLDSGRRKEEIVLNSATSGLMIDDMIWHEMHDFSKDCIILVLADMHYDESDYIRGYSKFLEELDE